MPAFGADQLVRLSDHLANLRAAVQLAMVNRETFGALLDRDAQAFVDDFASLEAVCGSAGLPTTLAALRRTRTAMDNEGLFFLRERLDRLRDILQDESAAIRVVVVRQIDSSPDSGSLADSLIARRFPAWIQDLQDATACISIGLGSAGVFHLMRVMELAVQRLGRTLKIPADVRHANWGQITDQADRALRALPAKTSRDRSRRDALAEAIAHLNAVRIAWRNPVMHPKRAYSDREAQAIYAHVVLFLTSLATLPGNVAARP